MMKKGEREQHRFGATCWHVRLEIAHPVNTLRVAIDAEAKKPIVRGERQKRLRTLLDALTKTTVDGWWWEIDRALRES